MRWLQLDPDSLVQRASKASEPLKGFTLGNSVRRGILGFTVLSVAGFMPWAFLGRFFQQWGGELGMYLACAAVFIGLCGPLLHRLILGTGTLTRFYALFGIAFSVYAVLWIVAWMRLGGHLGSVLGLMAGTAAMAGVMVQAFQARAEYWKVFLLLFVLNAAGYFLGGVVEGAVMALSKETLASLSISKAVKIRTAMLLWGVFYGVGFGAGLGAAFYCCQSEARCRLAARPVPA